MTCEDLTGRALAAIADNDQAGRKLRSAAEIGADVIFRARAIDQEIRAYGLKSPLHGIPVLLKDNIDVAGMHTTAGSLAPVSGNPCMSLPAVRVSEEDFRPISCYLMARAYEEEKLFAVAGELERRLSARSCPEWAKEF